MGFVSALVPGVRNWVGNAFNDFTSPDKFQATTPQQGPQGDYAAAIQQAQQQALAANGMSGATASNQDALAQALMAQANGQGPSLAQQQLQQATQANSAQAAGAIASQRGLNPALAARLISQQQAAGNQQAAGQSAMLRLQEQLGARGQLGQTLAAQRSGDINQIQANTGIFGTAGQLQGGQNALYQQGQLAPQAINAEVAGKNADFRGKVIGGVMSGAGSAMSAAALAGGGPVPGQARVSGDSPENDTVPAKLSPGEIVIPRSVAQSDDAPARAAAFVEAIKNKGTDAGGYGQVLQRHRELDERLKRLEMLAYGGQVGGSR